MNLAVSRLVLVSALFAGWIGYLGFQVATLPQVKDGGPLILSHPQIMASEIDIVADVPDKTVGTTITVKAVLYPANAVLQPGDKIQVTNISECQALRRGEGKVPALDWSGPGDYLLPLRALPDKKYEVTPIPPSPGFYDRDPISAPPRLYPATEQALAQYRHIKKPEAK